MPQVGVDPGIFFFKGDESTINSGFQKGELHLQNALFLPFLAKFSDERGRAIPGPSLWIRHCLVFRLRWVTVSRSLLRRKYKIVFIYVVDDDWLIAVECRFIFVCPIHNQVIVWNIVQRYKIPQCYSECN